MKVGINDIEHLPFTLRNIWTDLDELKVRVSDLESPHSDEAWMARLDSNSEHAAQERAYLEERIADLEDILGSVYLYINWRYVTKQLTTPQKELFAQSVEHSNVRLDPSLYPGLEVDRWWRD